MALASPRQFAVTGAAVVSPTLMAGSPVARSAPPVMARPPVGTTNGTWNVDPVGAVATRMTVHARPR